MGLLKTAAKAAVASSVHGRVQRRQHLRWARQDAAAAQQGAPPPSPLGLSDIKDALLGAASSPPPPPPPPPHEQLARTTPSRSSATDVQTQLALIAQLNELRTAGALTEAEFEAKKAEILQL